MDQSKRNVSSFFDSLLNRMDHRSYFHKIWPSTGHQSDLDHKELIIFQIAKLAIIGGVTKLNNLGFLTQN